MKHSNVVGGSTAKRVMACPGSVALCEKMPPKPSSTYADEGTLLHELIAEYLEHGTKPDKFIGRTYEAQTLTEDLLHEKLLPAIKALDELDPEGKMDIAVETNVSFDNEALSGVFGSTDLLGRIGDTAYVIDWKFGDGVLVTAEQNPQLMFYAAAAMRTPSVKWVFDGATAIECIIVQPTRGVSRWTTTPERIAQFEIELTRAVKKAQLPDADLNVGDHCRWCAAKPTCPMFTGAVDRALKTKFDALDNTLIGAYLLNADLLEDWIKDLRNLAISTLERGNSVPGYKLVAKRGTRQWVNEDAAKEVLLNILDESEVVESSLLSPAKVEKLLKKRAIEMPEGLVVSISSGNTLASEDDPRPSALLIGQQLNAALSKIGI
jgi:hypothetical protein